MTADDAEALLAIQAASYVRAGEGLRSSWPQVQALDAEGMADLLDRRRYAVLATARPDGRAQAAPIAFLVADGAFWFATVAGARLRNLRARPWASLVVMEGERDEDEPGDAPLHRALTAEGPVRLHEGAAFDEARTRLDERWIPRHGHAPTWAVALAELTPERLYSHAAGGL